MKQVTESPRSGANAQHVHTGPSRDRRRFWGWISIGLALRFLLLPVALHPDLLAIYNRVGLWNDGAIALHDFNLQALPMLLHGICSDLLGVGLPDLRDVSWPMSFDEVNRARIRILGDPNALAYLSGWKLPYALVDIGCGILAARLVSTDRALATLRLWMLHPVVLYVVVLFGRYEPFMLLPLLVGLIAIHRNRPHWGFVWIGIAVAMRLYPAMVVLPMVLVAAPSVRRRLEYLALAGTPLGVVLAACALRSHVAWLLLPVAFYGFTRLYVRVRGGRGEVVLWTTLAGALVWMLAPALSVLDNPHYSAGPLLQHSSYLTQSRISLSPSDAILLLGLLYGCVCVWAHRLGSGRADGLPVPFDDVVDAGLLASLAFFALSFFNPQYFLLLVCLVILRMHRVPEAGPAHALQLVGLFLFLTVYAGGRTTTTWLFAPIAPIEILRLPGPIDLLPARLAGIEWPTIGRTLLVLGCAWMAFELIRARRTGDRAVTRRAGMLTAGMLVWPIGLASIMGVAILGDRVIKMEFDPMDDVWQMRRPFDAVGFDTTHGIPATIEMREVKQPVVPSEKHIIEVLSDNGDSPPDPPQRLVVDAEELLPDSHGIVSISLAGLDLVQGKTYRLAWRSGGFGTKTRATEMRFGYALQPLRTAKRIVQRAGTRLWRAGFFTVAWLMLVLGSLGLGIVLLRSPGRTGLPPLNPPR